MFISSQLASCSNSVIHDSFDQKAKVFPRIYNQAYFLQFTPFVGPILRYTFILQTQVCPTFWFSTYHSSRLFTLKNVFLSLSLWFWTSKCTLMWLRYFWSSGICTDDFWSNCQICPTPIPKLCSNHLLCSTTFLVTTFEVEHLF